MSPAEGNGTPEESGDVATAATASGPVPEFTVVDAAPVARSASPTVAFTVEVTESTGLDIYTVALTALIEIEPSKRSYGDSERERLVELFGSPERWASTTSPLRWTQADVLVPSFKDSASFQIKVPCTYDLEVAATKYFGGLERGVAPLRFHFNGTIFYADANGAMQLVQVPWDCTTRFPMPVATWRRMIDEHYPFRGWIPLHKETIDRLAELKAERALTTFDATVAGLLDEQTETSPSETLRDEEKGEAPE